MRLSEHFTLDEFIRSDKAAELGIDNYPPPEVLLNLQWLAGNMEAVRALFGDPIIITSGYRCPQLNQAVGGVVHSDHVRGMAADFKVPAFGTPHQVCMHIAYSGVPYQQLILEFDNWTHISFPKPGEMARRERLTIRAGTGYLQGILARGEHP